MMQVTRTRTSYILLFFGPTSQGSISQDCFPKKYHWYVRKLHAHCNGLCMRPIGNYCQLLLSAECTRQSRCLVRVAHSDNMYSMCSTKMLLFFSSTRILSGFLLFSVHCTCSEMEIWLLDKHVGICSRSYILIYALHTLQLCACSLRLIRTWV